MHIQPPVRTIRNGSGTETKILKWGDTMDPTKSVRNVLAYLTDKAITESYDAAVELGLDEEFVSFLGAELHRRGLLDVQYKGAGND